MPVGLDPSIGKIALQIEIDRDGDHEPARWPSGAISKGTKFGSPSTLDASQKRKIAERHAAGETMAELAEEYEVGEATIWRALQAAA